MTRCALGIDIGATNTRIAVVDDQGNILESQHLPSNMAAGAPFFEEVGRRAAALARRHKAVAMGAGTAGRSTGPRGSTFPACTPRPRGLVCPCGTF